MTNSDSGTAIQVRAIKEYLLARKISPETLRCLFAGFELDSVVALVKSHFGNFPGIETATRVAVQSILLEEIGGYRAEHDKEERLKALGIERGTCEGCYQNPCTCLSNDAPCDPE